MEPRRIVLVTSNRNIKRRVTRSLASVGSQVIWCSPRRQEVLAQLDTQPDMCIIDADENHDDVRWLLQTLYDSYRNIISLLISHDDGRQFLVELLSNENLNNLVAKHGGFANSTELIDESELIVTCQKLFLRDIFGLEKYLPNWAITIHERELASTDDKREAISELEGFLDVIDCYGAIKNAVVLVADELIMNAVFHAPRNAVGEAKYVDTNRRERIALDPNERVRFRYACDGKNIALSVTDRFGSLSRNVIVKYLQRCLMGGSAEMEDKKVGAGLGLYMVFNSITQLVFNIHVGVATEVITSFYVRSGSRAFKAAGRSLNIFFLQ